MTMTRWTTSLLALALAGCADMPRSLGELGAAPSEAPPLYRIERDFERGRITIDPARPADLAPRVALVVGIQNYDAVVALENPVGDARAMAALLRDNGYRVVEA
ncbi:MAG: caspase family protein, partial [Pseudomonadota bacterium]